MKRNPETILDELLVLRCQAGDPRAMEQLVIRYQNRLTQIARVKTGNREAARDLVQDAWMAVVRNIRRLDDPARFRGWLDQIMRNKCIDWIRRQARQRKALVELRRQPDPEDSNHKPVDEEHRRLRNALKQLDPQRRRILVEFYLNGRSVDEISTQLGIPSGTVKSRLFHARNQLRQVLERSDDERSR